MDRAALLSRCEDAYQGIRDARGLNAIIAAVQRAEDALGVLILALEPEEMTATAPVIVPIDPTSPALQSTAGGGYWRVDDRDW
jgi:hypothetical protein